MMNPNPDKDTYACEYPCKDGPCTQPAFDRLELLELEPPLEIRVCATHWLEHKCPERTHHTLPPEPAPDPDKLLSGQSIQNSAQNSSLNLEGTRRPEALRDLDELLPIMDKRRRMLCRCH